MNKELVSIIIPTCNRSTYLEQAIKSVTEQNNPNIELIIINDGSTDNTETIINNYSQKYSFITHLYQENKGAVAARNLGIGKSSGDYLIFLDDDDLLIFNCIEKLLTTIKNQPENVKIVCGNLIVDYGDIKSRRLGNSFANAPRSEILFRFLSANHITPGQLIIDREAVIEAGCFSPEYPYAEDYHLWTKILYKYDIAYIPNPVLLHRKHPGQVTSKEKGLIRYYSDKVAFKFLAKINPVLLLKERARQSGIFLEQDIQQTVAAKLEKISLKMLDYPWTHFDTALEILNIAQQEFFESNRQSLIEQLEREIPELLKNKFQSELRLSSEDKLVK